jgi:hypothetical protein
MMQQGFLTQSGHTIIKSVNAEFRIYVVSEFYPRFFRIGTNLVLVGATLIGSMHLQTAL